MQMPDNDVRVQMSTVNYAAANLDCFLVYAGASELRLFWEISRQSKNFSEMSAFGNYPTGDSQNSKFGYFHHSLILFTDQY